MIIAIVENVLMLQLKRELRFKVGNGVIFSVALIAMMLLVFVDIVLKITR